MSAAERLRAAIEKLEALHASDGGDWRAEAPGIVADGGVIVRDEFMYEEHQALIATLHRTIEPQIAILRAALDIASPSAVRGYPVLPHDHASLALADAILGGAQ